MKVGIVFLHENESTGNELKSFLDIVALTEFNYKSFNEVILRKFGWMMNLPSAKSIEYSPKNGAATVAWCNLSADANILGPDDTYEDVSNFNISVNKVSIDI
jgi:hypothetical protein